MPLAHSLESWGRYAAPQQISSVPEIGIQYHATCLVLLYSYFTNNLPSGKLADLLVQCKKTGPFSSFEESCRLHMLGPENFYLNSVNLGNFKPPGKVSR